jgi:hypothetical protein
MKCGEIEEGRGRDRKCRENTRNMDDGIAKCRSEWGKLEDGRRSGRNIG